MPPPLILVAGSADPNRADYSPALVATQTALAAAEQIGMALAQKGWRIAVYSANQAFIEAAVVRGFARSLKKNSEAMVEVWSPAVGDANALFAEAAAQPKMFTYRTDNSSDWEASFYRSLRDADGIVVIGGGQSTLTMGYIALGLRVPLLPLACFGGTARRIWNAMRPDADLPNREEHALMCPPKWQNDHANRLVDVLLAQRARLQQQRESAATALRAREGRQALRACLAAILIVAVLGMIAMALMSESAAPTLWSNLLLLGVGPISGAAAALGLSAWSEDGHRSPLTTFGLGLLAGATASLAFLVAQFSASVSTPVGRPALFVAALIGLSAGYTLDRVFRQASEGKLLTGNVKIANPSGRPVE